MQEQERLEWTRRFYSALAEGDRPLLDALLHPDFVGITTRGLPLGLGGVYRGPASMRRQFWGALARHYEVRALIEEVLPVAQDRVQVTGRYLGVGAASGTPLDARFVHLLRFAEGRLLALEQVTDSALWHAALKPATPAVELQIEAGIAHIRLNRADANNGFDESIPLGLLDAARRCAVDPSIRVVLLSGKGRSFTVGGDIHFMAELAPAELPATLARMTSNYHEALRLLNRLPVPVVAAVQGVAAGGGLGLLYCADLVLAAEDSRFALGFAALGLPMDGGNSWFLPRLVGARRAAELYFEQRVLDAHEAREWGLINRVVPLASLQAEAWACAERLAAGAPGGFAEARRQLRQSWDKSLSEQLEAETDGLARAAAAPGVAESMQAFLRRR